MILANPELPQSAPWPESPMEITASRLSLVAILIEAIFERPFATFHR